MEFETASSRQAVANQTWRPDLIRFFSPAILTSAFLLGCATPAKKDSLEISGVNVRAPAHGTWQRIESPLPQSPTTPSIVMVELDPLKKGRIRSLIRVSVFDASMKLDADLDPCLTFLTRFSSFPQMKNPGKFDCAYQAPPNKTTSNWFTRNEPVLTAAVTRADLQFSSMSVSSVATSTDVDGARQLSIVAYVNSPVDSVSLSGLKEEQDRLKKYLASLLRASRDAAEQRTGILQLVVPD